MAKEAVKTMIYGIKCDNPNCNYKDMSVPFEDYSNWVNRPCPLCGENLLTEKDYRKCKMAIWATNVANKLFKVPDDYDGSQDVEMHLDFKDDQIISKITPAETYVDDGTMPELTKRFNKSNAEWLELELIKARKAGKTKELKDIDTDTLQILIYCYKFSDDHLSYFFNIPKQNIKSVKQEKGIFNNSLRYMMYDMQPPKLYDVNVVYENCLI